MDGVRHTHSCDVQHGRHDINHRGLAGVNARIHSRHIHKEWNPYQFFVEGRMRPAGIIVPEPVQPSTVARVEGHLSELPSVLAEVEAVIRCEHNCCVFHQTHIFNPPQKVADPGVHHRDFAAVSRISFPDSIGRESRLILPVTVDWLDYLAVEVWPVQL